MRINFKIRTEKDAAPIYVRILGANKKDVMARTNWSINPKDWSKSKGQPKNLTKEVFKELDSNLRNFKNDLINEINALDSFDELNTKWLKNIINPSTQAFSAQDALPKDLIGYLDYYLSVRKGDIKASTVMKFMVVRARLVDMEKVFGGTIFVKDVNLLFKTKLVEYYQGEGYAENTIFTAVLNIKTLCKHAEISGIKVHRQLKLFTYKKEDVKKIYLTTEEIEKIENTDFSKDKRLDNARDWLIISCFTGQRVSDFMRFTPQMVNRSGGFISIDFEQVKTLKKMSIALHWKVEDILDKRNGEFPNVTQDHTYNVNIKEVCKLAGITEIVEGSKDILVGKRISKAGKECGKYRKVKGKYPKYELITSHIGRRSFATNFFGKISISRLMSATGHRTEDMFLNYVGKTHQEMAREMSQEPAFKRPEESVEKLKAV